MHKKIALLGALLAVLVGCGRTTETESAVTLDVRDLPRPLQTQNPVGVLKVAQGKKYGLCTVSIVERKYIFTAGHCVILDGRQASANQMKLYFQNFRDSSNTQVQVTGVLRAVFNTTTREDWAVLEVADPAPLANRFGSFSLAGRRFETFGVAATEAFVFDPEDNGYHFVFRAVSGASVRGVMSEIKATYETVGGNSGAPMVVGDRIVGVVTRGGTRVGLYRTQATELFPEIARVGLP